MKIMVINFIYNAVPIVVGVAIIYLLWLSIATKEYDFLVGLGALILVPLSILLIANFPLPSMGIIYVICFALLWGGRKGAEEEVEHSTLAQVAWRAAKYTAVILIVAFLIYTVFNGAGGGGSCGRASPQYC